MKKLLVLLMGVIFLSGCVEQKEPNKRIIIQESELGYGEIKILIIDSCEYVIYHGYHEYSMTHKGNCKFCKQRCYSHHFNNRKAFVMSTHCCCAVFIVKHFK